MHLFTKEVDVNFDAFFDSIPVGVNSALTSLATQKERFRQSYRRIVSLQAWRVELIEHIIENEALEFFIEAQNDALTSHYLARQGGWRVALMSLRSCIENTLWGIYYAEHPVELTLWKSGDHRLGFTDTIGYITKHPAFIGMDEVNTGIAIIKGEFLTLSKAVHGSSKLFRMTKGGNIKIENANSMPDLGAWDTREKLVLTGLNNILMTYFRGHISGAAHPNLRKALSLVIPLTKHADIKTNLGITLRKP